MVFSAAKSSMTYMSSVRYSASGFVYFLTIAVHLDWMLDSVSPLE